MQITGNDILWSSIFFIIGIAIPLYALFSTRHQDNRRHVRKDVFALMAVAIVLLGLTLFTTFDITDLSMY